MKSYIRKGTRAKVVLRAGLAALLTIAVVTPAHGADAPIPTTLIAPAGIPDIPAIPFTGTKSAPFTTPQTMVNMTVTPNQGVVGDYCKVTGSKFNIHTYMVYIGCKLGSRNSTKYRELHGN